MSDQALVTVEATGETVGEAKWAALRELEQLVPGPRPRERVVPGRVGGRARASRRRLHAGARHREHGVGARRRASRAPTEGDDIGARPRDRRADRGRDRRRRRGVRARARVRSHRHLLRPRRRAVHRQARADDRRDPVPGERDHARRRRPARGRRRCCGLSRTAHRDTRDVGASARRSAPRRPGDASRWSR